MRLALACCPPPRPPRPPPPSPRPVGSARCASARVWGTGPALALAASLACRKPCRAGRQARAADWWQRLKAEPPRPCPQLLPAARSLQAQNPAAPANCAIQGGGLRQSLQWRARGSLPDRMAAPTTHPCSEATPNHRRSSANDRDALPAGNHLAPSPACPHRSSVHACLHVVRITLANGKQLARIVQVVLQRDRPLRGACRENGGGGGWGWGRGGGGGVRWGGWGVGGGRQGVGGQCDLEPHALGA